MPPALIFNETFHKDPSELEAISRLGGLGLGGVSFESQPVGSWRVWSEIYRFWCEGSGLRGWDFLGSGAIQAWWNCLQIERLRGGAYCWLWAWVIGYDWMGGKSNKTKDWNWRIIGIETLNRLLLFITDSCVYLFKWAHRSQGTLAAHEEHRTLLSVTGTPVLGLCFGTNWWREKHSEARPAANELILHYRFHKMQCFCQILFVNNKKPSTRCLYIFWGRFVPCCSSGWNHHVVYFNKVELDISVETLNIIIVQIFGLPALSNNTSCRFSIPLQRTFCNPLSSMKTFVLTWLG